MAVPLMQMAVAAVNVSVSMQDALMLASSMATYTVIAYAVMTPEPNSNNIITRNIGSNAKRRIGSEKS